MKDKLNIILFSHTFLPTIGGRELVVHYLAKSLFEQGHNVRIVGPAGYRSLRDLVFPYEVHRYPRILSYWFNNNESNIKRWALENDLTFQLLFDIYKEDCDIIHAHMTYPTGYAAARLGRIFKKHRLIITPHGIDIDSIPELNYGIRLNSTLRTKVDIALNKADMVTAISSGIETSLLKAGVSPKKIVRIPNGVDFDRFQAISNYNVRDSLSVPSDTRLIVTVGNYHPRKGFETIIEAMPSILHYEPKARLIIVGKNCEILKPLIKKLKLSDKIILTGSVTYHFTKLRNNNSKFCNEENDILTAIYNASDVYISAGVTENAEGLSLAVIEAMAAGLPIIGTKIKGNLDIIKEGYNGLLISPLNPTQIADSIIKIFNDIQLQREMKKNSKNVAKKYHWKNITSMYIQVYKKIIENHNKMLTSI